MARLTVIQQYLAALKNMTRQIPNILRCCNITARMKCYTTGFQNMTKQRHSNLPNHDTPVPGQTSKWQVLPERGKVFYCKATARMFESVNLNLYKCKTLIYLTNIFSVDKKIHHEYNIVNFVNGDCKCELILNATSLGSAGRSK